MLVLTIIDEYTELQKWPLLIFIIILLLQLHAFETDEININVWIKVTGERPLLLYWIN